METVGHYEKNKQRCTFLRKAFIFTLDSAIAAVIAAALLSGIVLASNSAQVEHAPLVTLRQTAEDALAAMDKQGVLKAVFTQSDAAAQASVYSFLNSSIPASLGANITVEIFGYETGGSCSNGCNVDGNSPVNSFCTCKRLNNSTAAACTTQSPCKYSSKATRIAYQFVSNQDRLALATLEVWEKGS